MILPSNIMEYKTPFHRFVGIGILVNGFDFTEYEVEPEHKDAIRWKIITCYGESLNYHSIEAGKFAHKLFSQAYTRGLDDKVYEIKKALGLERMR